MTGICSLGLRIRDDARNRLPETEEFRQGDRKLQRAREEREAQPGLISKQQSFLHVFPSRWLLNSHCCCAIHTTAVHSRIFTGDYNNALKYADEALKAERWNANAIVNKANCLFQRCLSNPLHTPTTTHWHRPISSWILFSYIIIGRKKYEDAKKQYIVAVQAEGDCHNAIYNLGLTFRQLKQYPQALEQFGKLQAMLPDNPDVLYQVASLNELLNNPIEAARVYKRLMGACPNDPGILAKLGALYNKQKDDPEAFHYYEMSYRYYPVNMDVISWLGAWYVKSNVFEKAISFFERAAQIEPDEVKWRLMIASCHRRSGHDKKALSTYQVCNVRTTKLPIL